MPAESELRALLEACRSGTTEARRAAVVRLEELRAGEATPALVELSSSQDEMIRSNVASALGALGGGGEALLALARDPAALVRMTAIESLGVSTCREGLPVILSALETDGDPLVRLHAAEALRSFDDAGARTALVAALSDPDDGVRAYAADSMGAIGDVGDVMTLRRQLDTEQSPLAKAFILSALSSLGDQDALWELLAMTPEVGDTLGVTILNLAAEHPSQHNAARLTAEIARAAEGRSALAADAEALTTRIAGGEDSP